MRISLLALGVAICFGCAAVAAPITYIATLNGATFMGLADRIGSTSPGQAMPSSGSRAWTACSTCGAYGVEHRYITVAVSLSAMKACPSPAEISNAKDRLVKVNSNSGILFSPSVPYLDTLIKNLQLLAAGHVLLIVRVLAAPELARWSGQ